MVQVHWRLCNKGVMHINYVNCVAPTSVFTLFGGKYLITLNIVEVRLDLLKCQSVLSLRKVSFGCKQERRQLHCLSIALVLQEYNCRI